MSIIAIDLSESRKKNEEQRKREVKIDRRRRKPDPLNLTMAPVIAIDPGQTTGWSLMIANPESLINSEFKVLDNIVTHNHGQVMSVRSDAEDVNDGESLAVDELWQLIQAWPEAAVVMEDFVIRIHDRSRQFLSPVRIMARLDYLLWKHDRIRGFRQSPSDAKNTCTDARLKEWGFYDKYGGLNHARDADRHALLFLRKCKQNEHMRKRAWPHLFAEGGSFAKRS